MMMKRRRHERRRSKEAKAIAASKIVVNLPYFTGKDRSEFAQSFGRFLEMTGQTHTSGRVKVPLLWQSWKTKYLEKQLKQIVTKSATFANVLVALDRQYTSNETDLPIWTGIQKLVMLPNKPKAARVSELLADLDHWLGQLTPGLYGSNELFSWLVAEIPRDVWNECQATPERKARTFTYEDLSVLVLELALEKRSDQHLNAYRPGGGKPGNQCLGYQGPQPEQGSTANYACFMSNVQELLWCDARDEKGGLVYAPDCDRHECFLVQGKKQETNTAGKAKMPDPYRCAITSAFCGKRKHY